MNSEVLSALFEFAGRRAWAVAWPMAWQVSLLVLALLVVEALLRRRLRPAVRHALWLLVPIKLLLPPSLALPLAPAYWLPVQEQATTGATPRSPGSLPPTVEVTYYPSPSLTVTTHQPPGLRELSPRQRVAATLPGLFLACWTTGSLVLLVHLLRRTASLQRLRREATQAPESLRAEAAALAARMGCRRPLDLRLAEDGTSPALLGWRRPTILLPRGLSESLHPDQRRAVLIHEIAHARRGDLAVHALQTLLLLAWWWNPFVWVANARLRAAREECVDDTVAWELGPEAEIYPATLLAVARTTLQRPRLAIGLIGILESRSALRRRIQRLLDQPHPGRPGLGWVARIAVVVTALILLPMAPRPAQAATPSTPPAATATDAPNPQSDLYTVEAAPAEERLRRLTTEGLYEPDPPPMVVRSRALVPASNAEPSREAIQTQLTASERELEQLLTRHQAKWPAVIDAQRRVDSLRLALATLPPATVSSPNGPPPPLEIRLEMPRFVEALERAVGRPLGGDPAVWREALLAHLQQSGFDPAPPHRVDWDFRRNALFLHGPPDRVALVRQILEKLSAFPAYLLFESRFIQLTQADAQALRLSRFEPLPPAGPAEERTLTVDLQPPTRFVSLAHTNVLNPVAFQALLDELKRRPGSTLRATPRITTLEGRAASISMHGDTNGAPAYTFDIEPGLLDEEGRLPLVVRAHVSEVLSVTTAPAIRSATGDGGTTFAPGAAFYLDRRLTNTAVVPDGHSLVLTDFSDTPPPGALRLLVLVTVTRIDAAGNPWKAASSTR